MISGTCSARSPVVGVGQVTVMVGSPLGLLFVSTHLEFSKRFYVTWERSKAASSSRLARLAAPLRREQEGR